MPSESSKKRLEKVTTSQYALLRELTDEGPVDAASLENTIVAIVKDRFEMARGFIAAAKTLARSRKAMIRRSAVSRAYYGGYQAARATLLSISRRDEGDHEKLGKDIGSIEGMAGAPGDELKELRQVRNEFDYSPYPGPKPGMPYDPKKIEAIIRESVERAEKLVDAFERVLRERR